MTDAIGIAASVLLPWVAGTLLVRALWRGAPGGPGLLAIGYGYLVGTFAVTLVMRALSYAGIPWSLPVLAGSLVVLGAVAWWPARHARAAWPRATTLRDTLAAEAPAMRWLFAIALALIVVRLAGLGVEIAASPLRAYDAWAHWATKARVWFDQGRIMAFVPPDVWLARGDPALYTDTNPGHPGTIPLLQAWTATFLTGWNESLINAPWLAIAAALGVAFYAQLRHAGASAPMAMVGTWLLMSLPILDIHVRLAGAADIFMGAAYGMAAMATWRWSQTREAPMAWLALIAAVAGLQVKVEGMLWMATLVPGVVTALHRRAGVALAGAAALAFLAYLAFGPERTMVLGYMLLTRPINVLDTVLEHVLAFDNWHLMGYGVIGVLAWRRRFLFEPCIAPMTMTMLAAAGLVVVVYFFTAAAIGVANETLVNRFLLHLAPPLAFYTLFVYFEGRGRSGDQPSLQATKAADA